MPSLQDCCCRRLLQSAWLEAVGGRWRFQAWSSSRRSFGRKRKDACGGRGAGQASWQGVRVGSTSFLATLSELRGGGSGLVSRLPSGEGGWAYSPGRFWTAQVCCAVPYGTVRASSLQAGDSLIEYALCPLASQHLLSYSRRGRDRVQYNFSSVRHGTPVLHLGLFPSPATPKCSAALGNEECVALPCPADR